ncbi:MAG: hypothetical protein ACJA1F_002281 [Paracoccaceae bacterium]|jgi:hypothetical protein
MRDENAAFKKGGVPEDWKNMPAKRSQKDRGAGWRVAGQKTVGRAVFLSSRPAKAIATIKTT